MFRYLLPVINCLPILIVSAISDRNLACGVTVEKVEDKLQSVEDILLKLINQFSHLLDVSISAAILRSVDDPFEKPSATVSHPLHF
jgi:CRP-like cAMP-binding protein